MSPLRLLVQMIVFAGVALISAHGARAAEVTVGSKAFTESVILGEMAAQLARSIGVEARHRRELGGTRVLWNALTRGDIDIYPEYTGTLREEILAGEGLREDGALSEALARHGLVMLAPLGFNNTYAIGMLEIRAAELDIETVSDLSRHSGLALGFGNEFMDRADGWPALRERYRLPHRNVRGLAHDLAYRGLAAGNIDVMDLYATDAEIDYYDIRVLKDDLGHFPAYDAVFLIRSEVARNAPELVTALGRLAGTIDDATMTRLNRAVKIEGAPEAEVAASFLEARLGASAPLRAEGRFDRLLRHTWEHLLLVGISLSAAIAVAIPLGIAAWRRPRLGVWILGTVGMVQTIPALALLVFMIPLLGIGGVPAVAALFLYSLLPVVRNTHAGLAGVPEPVRRSARALGLGARDRLLRIDLPLAAPTILAGIKTAAVINVGTATLGALIGAGGYGQPILTGIRLDDVGLILEGAVPAAVMALAVQHGFNRLEIRMTPQGTGEATQRPA